MICRWELGKFFLGVAEDDEQTLKHPAAAAGARLLGLRRRARSCTRRAVFFYGGGRFIGTSPGWRGDVLTFSGTMSAGGESFGDAAVVQRRRTTTS